MKRLSIEIKMMQLRWFAIIFCIGFSLNASQKRNDLGWLFFSTDISKNIGHIGIYYNPQHCMKQDNDLN